MKVKKTLLKLAPKVIQRQEQLAKDEDHLSPAQKQLFDTVSKLVLQYEEPIKMNFREGDIEIKINDILQAVSKGEITPTQGQKMMEIVKTGYELIEVRQLFEKLNIAGLIPKQ